MRWSGVIFYELADLLQKGFGIKAQTSLKMWLGKILNRHNFQPSAASVKVPLILNFPLAQMISRWWMWLFGQLQVRLCNLIWMKQNNLTVQFVAFDFYGRTAWFQANWGLLPLYLFIFIWHSFQLPLHIMVWLLLQKPSDFIPFGIFLFPSLTKYLEAV